MVRVGRLGAAFSVLVQPYKDAVWQVQPTVLKVGRNETKMDVITVLELTHNASPAPPPSSCWKLLTASKSRPSPLPLPQMDVGGFPATLINFISRRQPLAIAYLRNYLMATSLLVSNKE